MLVIVQRRKRRRPYGVTLTFAIRDACVYIITTTKHYNLIMFVVIGY